MAGQRSASSPWVDRYVAEVGRMLPAKTRADVELEIRSLIEEEIEGRAGAEGTNEETALAVLKSFGRPQAIAARYGAQQYLIGPLLYPTFLTVLRIVVGVALALNIFGMALNLGGEGRWPGAIETFVQLFTTVLQAAGSVVLIFALIERLNSAERSMGAADGVWDPRTLPQVADGERVNVGETLFGIPFTVVALLALLVYFENIGLYGTFFTPEFRTYVPWLALWWGLELILNIVMVVRGRWSVWLRWAQVGIHALAVAILVQMLTGPALSAWPSVQIGLRITIGIILVVTIFEAGKNLVALIARSTAARAPTATAPRSR